MAERIQLMEAEAEAGAELAGELSGDTLESKFLQLEASGSNEDDALSELKAKMGMLEAPKESKQLGAGAAASSAASAKVEVPAASGGLSAEDMKELEDLDLAELEKDLKK
jgi:hypothetical protein